MALITFSAAISDARNSNGGVVFSRNLGGAYMRARVAPVNRRTPAQTLVRANFAANSKAWSQLLTASQRSAWTFFAQANPLRNVLGASIIVSGIAMFQKLNQVLAQVGSAMITDPPIDLSVPALAAPIDLDGNAGGPGLTVNTAAQSVVAGAEYYIFASPPMSPGKTASVSDMRFIGAYPSVAAAVIVDIYAAWSALFGPPAGAGGQTVGALVGTVNTTSGAVTPGLRLNTIFT